MRKAAEILARLLDKGPAGASSFHSLFGGWQEIAGPSLAEHCLPYEVRHHALLVEVDHPGWMQLLLMQKKAILTRIQRRFPQLELRELKVRVSMGGSGRPPSRGSPGQEPQPASEARASAPAADSSGAAGPLRPETRQALEAVDDPELREKLRLLLQELERRIDTSDDK